jgi:hypothetical protein
MENPRKSVSNNVGRFGRKIPAAVTYLTFLLPPPEGKDRPRKMHTTSAGSSQFTVFPEKNSTAAQFPFFLRPHQHLWTSL